MLLAGNTLYLSNGSTFTATADAITGSMVLKTLDDYEEGTVYCRGFRI